MAAAGMELKSSRTRLPFSSTLVRVQPVRDLVIVRKKITVCVERKRHTGPPAEDTWLEKGLVGGNHGISPHIRRLEVFKHEERDVAVQHEIGHS